MSIANDLRKAAVTWPMPELSEVGFAQLNAFSEFGELILRNETQIRIFMLFIACALDDGPRVPMNANEAKVITWPYVCEKSSPALLNLIRAVERFHGIGMEP
jgi:hypothetical protein